MSGAVQTPPDILDSGEAGGRAIRGGAVRMAAYVVGLGMSLVSVPLLVRHLGVDDYGRYVTVSAILFIIGGVTEAGLTNLGLRQYSQLDGVERDRYLQALTGLRFALTATGVLVAVALTAVTGAEHAIVIGVAIAGAGLFLSLTSQTYSIPLSAQLRLGWVSALELLKQTVLTGATVALVIAGSSLVPFFWANVAAAIAVLSATLLVVRREVTLRPRVDVAEWRRILREVLPYAMAAAVGLVYFRLAVILMSYIASDRQAGIYATAFRIVEVVGVIPWIAVSSGFPILARAARDDSARLRYALQRLFEVSTIVGGGFAVVIALGAPFAIHVVAGGGFDDAIPVLRLLGLALLTSFLVATWSFALLSLKAHRQLLICNALAAVATAAGIVALEPLLDAEGAAIATVAGEGVLALAYLVALRRADHSLSPQLGIVVKVGLAGAAAMLVFALGWPAVPATLLGGALYALVLLVTKAVPPELAHALLRRGTP